jgi:phosphatidate cytidylyltransferase
MLNLRRFVSGALLIPLVSIPAYFGGPLYFVLILAIATMAAYEYDELMRNGGYRPPRRWGVVLILLLLADAAFPGNDIMRSGLPLFVMLTLALMLRAQDLTGALINWALMLSGAVYIGVLLAQFIVLRQLELGLWLSAMAGFTTWTSDSFALVFGLRFGRHRFAPRISPKKSWEGALGGGAVGVLVGTTWGYFTLPSIPFYHVFSLALLIVVGGMLGDLAESLIKRQVGAKDAGGLIPGHGGVLDRIDSMMFAFPLTALYATWILQLK